MQSPLECHICGPVNLSGDPDAFYERHVTFDQVVAETDTFARDKFEAFAHPVRDLILQGCPATHQVNRLSRAGSTRERFPTGMKFKYFLFRFESFVLALFFSMYSVRLQAQAPPPAQMAEALQPNQMPYFDAVPDPIEGFNRCSWKVNDWLFRELFYPVSFGYNFAVPKPVRTMIGNGGHNLTYPERFAQETASFVAASWQWAQLF